MEARLTPLKRNASLRHFIGVEYFYPCLIWRRRRFSQIQQNLKLLWCQMSLWTTLNFGLLVLLWCTYENSLFPIHLRLLGYLCDTCFLFFIMDVHWFYLLRISTICPSFSRSLDACVCVEQCVLRACSRHHRFKGPWTVPIEGQGRLKLSSTWGGWKMQMSSHFRRTWIFVLCPMRWVGWRCKLRRRG